MKQSITILFWVLFLNCNGQERASYNWIITIDDELVITPESTHFRVLNKDSKDTFFLFWYIPGDLSVERNNLDLLTPDSINIKNIEFWYNSHFYSIKVEPSWFNKHYFILRIYNLDKKKYRRRFEPFEKGANFTYEFDIPGFSFRRVSRR